ncbi:hypothetical protein [Derxia gummosa]|uniref:Uncharacterized protein n=1 Tax=Derxia gummosa DSM 723 TaxID=1121388 RepID=A0A8B6X754_9BURK|nr:hypothetical protein [Derxia gummosa]
MAASLAPAAAPSGNALSASWERADSAAATPDAGRPVGDAAGHAPPPPGRQDGADLVPPGVAAIACRMAAGPGTFAGTAA